MIIPVFFLLIFIVMMAGTTLEIGAITAQTAATNRANAYADVDMSRAISDYDVYLQDLVSYYGSTVVASQYIQQMPAFANQNIRVCNQPAADEGDPCPFYFRITVLPGQSTTAGSNGPDSSNELQSNETAENKFAVALEVDVFGKLQEAGAQPLAKRLTYLTYRVYNEAPYATLSGSRTVATDIGTTSGPGDSAGQYDPGPTDDTRIHTMAWCQQTGLPVASPNATPFSGKPYSEGLPWGNVPNGGVEVPCLTTSPSPTDDYTTRQWNANMSAATGWSL
ncbi:MAG TPA: hypothetical protein VME66_13615 [Candidatus Acidoferrales bacterium]|nr:hypothetical protein [Candidatus Acidoferrales bacterium]